ncbi:MAG: hypothetical protein K8F36_10290 [Melioribacteraceae bacterium]|nr:hypothetical protein [Melioribacteraceae bacterium]
MNLIGTSILIENPNIKPIILQPFKQSKTKHQSKRWDKKTIKKRYDKHTQGVSAAYLSAFIWFLNKDIQI